MWQAEANNLPWLMTGQQPRCMISEGHAASSQNKRKPSARFLQALRPTSRRREVDPTMSMRTARTKRLASRSTVARLWSREAGTTSHGFSHQLEIKEHCGIEHVIIFEGANEWYECNVLQSPGHSQCQRQTTVATSIDYGNKLNRCLGPLQAGSSDLSL
jgi:hypothetical protein